MSLLLSSLAVKYGSDKHGHHYYCDHYERHFAPFIDKKIFLLELGIGGYHLPDKGGASLLMWRDYFSNGMIGGVDIHDKSFLDGRRIATWKGSQDSIDIATAIVGQYGYPDIIIDDASHINDLSIRSFQIYFPQLKPGGIYVVEDTETAWCPADQWAKGCDDRLNMSAPTIINFLRGLLDDINDQYIPHYKAQYPIESMHFYKNIAFIVKSRNSS